MHQVFRTKLWCSISILLRFYEGEFINVDDLKIEVLDPMALFVWYCFIPAGMEKHILQYTSCCDTMALLMLSKSLVKTCSGCLGAQTLWPLQIWWAPQRCISWRMGFTAAVHFCIPTAEWCHEEGASSTGPPLVKVNDYFHRFHRLKSSHYKIEQRQFKM